MLFCCTREKGIMFMVCYYFWCVRNIELAGSDDLWCTLGCWLKRSFLPAAVFWKRTAGEGGGVLLIWESSGSVCVHFVWWWWWWFGCFGVRVLLFDDSLAILTCAPAILVALSSYRATVIDPAWSARWLLEQLRSFSAAFFSGGGRGESCCSRCDVCGSRRGGGGLLIRLDDWCKTWCSLLEKRNPGGFLTWDWPDLTR